MHNNEIDSDEYKWLLSGSTSVPKQLDNPSPDWISERSWGDILQLSELVSLLAFKVKFSMQTLEIIF